MHISKKLTDFVLSLQSSLSTLARDAVTPLNQTDSHASTYVARLRRPNKNEPVLIQMGFFKSHLKSTAAASEVQLRELQTHLFAQSSCKLRFVVMKSI
jgi:hypothetical protein